MLNFVHQLDEPSHGVPSRVVDVQCVVDEHDPNDGPNDDQYDVLRDVVDSERLHSLLPDSKEVETKTKSKLTFQSKHNIRLITFGLANLKISIAAERTIDKSPSVSAFQVFRAINANASGTSTVVLNFNPSKNGIITFLTNPRPMNEIFTLVNVYYANGQNFTTSVTFFLSFR